MAFLNLVNIGSGDGLLPGDNNTLPESVFIRY